MTYEDRLNKALPPVVKIINSHHNKKRRLKYYEVFFIYKGKKVNELTCRGIIIIK